VSEGSITADYRDGVLEIHVRKPEQPKPRRIRIGGGERATIEAESSKK
jgi:HSP20 family molecular chaperone IbpA